MFVFMTIVVAYLTAAFHVVAGYFAAMALLPLGQLGIVFGCGCVAALLMRLFIVLTLPFIRVALKVVKLFMGVLITFPKEILKFLLNRMSVCVTCVRDFFLDRIGDAARESIRRAFDKAADFRDAAADRAREEYQKVVKPLVLELYQMGPLDIGCHLVIGAAAAKRGQHPLITVGSLAVLRVILKDKRQLTRLRTAACALDVLLDIKEAQGTTYASKIKYLTAAINDPTVYGMFQQADYTSKASGNHADVAPPSADAVLEALGALLWCLCARKLPKLAPATKAIVANAKLRSFEEQLREDDSSSFSGPIAFVRPERVKSELPPIEMEEFADGAPIRDVSLAPASEPSLGVSGREAEIPSASRPQSPSEVTIGKAMESVFSRGSSAGNPDIQPMPPAVNVATSSAAPVAPMTADDVRAIMVEQFEKSTGASVPAPGQGLGYKPHTDVVWNKRRHKYEAIANTRAVVDSDFVDDDLRGADGGEAGSDFGIEYACHAVLTTAPETGAGVIDTNRILKKNIFASVRYTVDGDQNILERGVVCAFPLPNGKDGTLRAILFPRHIYTKAKKILKDRKLSTELSYKATEFKLNRTQGNWFNAKSQDSALCILSCTCEYCVQQRGGMVLKDCMALFSNKIANAAKMERASFDSMRTLYCGYYDGDTGCVSISTPDQTKFRRDNNGVPLCRSYILTQLNTNQDEGSSGTPVFQLHNGAFRIVGLVVGKQKYEESYWTVVLLIGNLNLLHPPASSGLGGQLRK